MRAEANRLILSGMERKAALLEAFKFCFPADYRACMVETRKDGEDDTLYEFLAGLVKASRLSEEGPVLNTDTKIVVSYPLKTNIAHADPAPVLSGTALFLSLQS